MAQGTWTTTTAEDAAVAALGNDASTDAFVRRHVRHQLDFALSTVGSAQAARLDMAYSALSAADRATVDALVAKVVPVPVTGIDASTVSVVKG